MKPTPKQPYKINARHIGPIMDLEGLDGELSNQNQNLIFASNGTGKSFLSRAFRYIAEHAENKNQENLQSIHELLVSKESEDGSAKFIFLKGETPLAKLEITAQNKNPNPVINKQTIFHVFSQDFIDTELRETDYTLHKKIFKETILGKDNIKLAGARKIFDNSKRDCAEEERLLASIFNNEKESELKNKAGLYVTLSEYKNLSVESCFAQNSPSQSSSTGRFLNEIIKDLDKLKSMPANLSSPEDLRQLLLDEIPYDKIQETLEKSISPSDIAKEIVKKIDAKPDFYKAGIALIIDEKLEFCPLCEQSLKDEAVKNIIITYIEYFSEAEEKAKERLKDYKKIINDKIKNIKNHEQNTTRQEKSFNNLKQYIPSQKAIIFENTDEQYKQIINILTELKSIIELKREDLSKKHKMPNGELYNILKKLNSNINDNNKKIYNIIKRYEKRTKERLGLRKELCQSFIPWFAKKYEYKIKIINDLKLDLEAQDNEIKRLEEANAKVNAKGLLASTFQDLLSDFFEKYSFDEKKFTIKLNGGDMPVRGNSKTLSDGEKSVMAFCYFIAMIHQKVNDVGDYEKLFLIFDDPVTSMSYDFVYSIAEVLKNLRILNGKISIKHKQKNESIPRPRLLILTHNSNFFNVAFTNGVVKPNAAFLFDTRNKKHKLSPSKEYMAEFHAHLKDIIFVANGVEDPSHTTANSIRSVLEAIQRFCWPNMELRDFFGYLEEHKGIKVKSTLIQNYSHGRPDTTKPPHPQLKLACEDVKKIAKEFMPGRNYTIET